MARSKLDAELCALVRGTYAAHNGDWDFRRTDMKLFRDLYASRFYGDTKGDPGTVRVETGDGPAHIESYLGSLFSRAPAVEVGKDPRRPDLSPKVPQALANLFLGRQRKVFEHAVRLGLIYPMAFLRVGPSASILPRRPGEDIEVRAVCPWDVITDTSASDWEHMRWVGHRYTLPLAQVRKKWPNISAAQWKPLGEKRFFERTSANSRRRTEDDELPDELKLVTIIEFYDLVRGKLIFWSAEKDHGESPIQVVDIPLRRPGTQVPCHPIVPLYFAYEPDAPVNGISTLARLYDQLREKNILRTNAANCIRRDSRQFLARKGAFSGEEAVKLRTAQDGEVIFTEEAYKGPLQDAIIAIPVAPMSTNFATYGKNIEDDLGKASPLAAFTRGEATRATATEIGVLAEYSANSIGRMANVRDNAIEGVGELYTAHRMLTPAGSVWIDGVEVLITKEVLDAEWTWTALDQAGTPMSKAIEQQRFTTLIPILQPMGIPATVILQEMVRLELITPAFNVAAAAAIKAAAAANATAAAPPADAGAPPAEAPSVDDLLRLAMGGPGAQGGQARIA